MAKRLEKIANNIPVKNWRKNKIQKFFKNIPKIFKPAKKFSNLGPKNQQKAAKLKNEMIKAIVPQIIP